jgi:hypothetical protein
MTGIPKRFKTDPQMQKMAAEVGQDLGSSKEETGRNVQQQGRPRKNNNRVEQRKDNAKRTSKRTKRSQRIMLHSDTNIACQYRQYHPTSNQNHIV